MKLKFPNSNSVNSKKISLAALIQSVNELVTIPAELFQPALGKGIKIMLTVEDRKKIWKAITDALPDAKGRFRILHRECDSQRCLER